MAENPTDISEVSLPHPAKHKSWCRRSESKKTKGPAEPGGEKVPNAPLLGPTSSSGSDGERQLPAEPGHEMFSKFRLGGLTKRCSVPVSAESSA